MLFLPNIELILVLSSATKVAKEVQQTLLVVCFPLVEKTFPPTFYLFICLMTNLQEAVS